MITVTQQFLRVCLYRSVWIVVSATGLLVLLTAHGQSAEEDSKPRLMVQTGIPASINPGVGAVSCVSLSSTGRLALTGRAEKYAVLWDTASGRQLGKFSGHTYVTAVSVNSSGSQVLTVGPSTKGQFAILWDVQSGRELRRMPLQATQGGRADVASISEAGNRVLASSGRSLKVWQASDGKRIGSLWHIREIVDASFSTDGQLVLVGGGKLAWLWSIEPNGIRRIRNFVHADEISAVSLGRNGADIVMTAGGRTIKVWRDDDAEHDQRSGGVDEQIRRDAFRTFSLSEKVLTAKLHRTEESVCALTESGRLVGWEVGSGRKTELGRIDLRNSAGRAKFSAQGSHLIMGYVDGRSRIWNLEDPGDPQTLTSRAAGVESVAISPDANLLLVGAGRRAQLWDLTLGRPVWSYQEGHRNPIAKVAFSMTGNHFLTSHYPSAIDVWTINGDRLGSSQQDGISSLASAALSADGKLLAAGDWNAAAACVWNVQTKKLLFRLPADSLKHPRNEDDPWGLDPTSVSLLERGDRVLVAAGRALGLYDVQGAHRIWQQLEGSRILSLALSNDESEVHVMTQAGVSVRNVATGTQTRLYQIPIDRADPTRSGAVTSDSSLLVSGTELGQVHVYSTHSGEHLRSLQGHTDEIMSVASARHLPFVVTGSLDGTTRIWNPTTGTELVRLIVDREGGWVAVDPAGRFDAPDLEGQALLSLHWLMPDDWLSPLSLEIFMRDYYEPKLVARVLAGEELPKIRPLEDLNRIQPSVEKMEIVANDSEDNVEVKVTVAGSECRFKRDGKLQTMTTGVFDLRLFRDGQLVGQRPRAAADAALPTQVYADEEREKWRQATMLCSAGESAIESFQVRLPRNRAGKNVELSAYAFNTDRVKSQTTRAVYRIPADLPPVRPRAILIAVGVNSYEDPRWNLQFAAADARLMATTLTPLLKRQGFEVINVRLVSDATSQPDEHAATKPNLRIALDRLSGHEMNNEAPAGIRSLPQATPDDLVLIFFSSHGYTDPVDGVYYFFPHDLGADFQLASNGAGQSVIPEHLLQRLISSEEMSRWLRPIDAGALVLIVDTCHAAATVDQPGFKPGPMGSRGLGQLAYDKGMRILTASQADNVALEVSDIKQGLLTYALVRDGLEDGGAANANTITIGGWLKYAEQRVPELYAEVLRGQINSVTPRDIVPIAPEYPRKLSVQTPTLFDFARKRAEIPLTRINNTDSELD